LKGEVILPPGKVEDQVFRSDSDRNFELDAVGRRWIIRLGCGGDCWCARVPVESARGGS
jgi:hypothetical protein